MRLHARRTPPFTMTIIVLCVAMWLVELLLRYTSTEAYNQLIAMAAFSPVTAVSHPWSVITSLFLHAPSVLHVLFNMLTLWMVGPPLERMLGGWGFLTLYMISGVGGGVGLMVWAVLSPGMAGWLTFAYGASGALFGLFAALLVAYYRSGLDIRSMLVWMGLNFLMPLVVPGIAWQAHVGGFIVGGAFAWLMAGGLPALRRRPLNTRVWIYGLTLLIVCVAAALALNAMQP